MARETSCRKKLNSLFTVGRRDTEEKQGDKKEEEAPMKKSGRRKKRNAADDEVWFFSNGRNYPCAGVRMRYVDCVCPPVCAEMLPLHSEAKDLVRRRTSQGVTAFTKKE